MSIQYYQMKYEYYRKWYSEMSGEERRSIVGDWVFKNCMMFCSLIQEFEAAKGKFNRDINLN